MELEKIKLGNKRAALELSIGTIVILVLAMSMLILGLILVRTIFSGATSTVEELDEKIRAEITDLFVEDETKIVLKLGADKTVRVKADNQKINVAFGARTKDGSTVDISNLKYKLSLDKGARDNCISSLGESQVEQFISQRINTALPFDKFEGDIAFAFIELQIQEGTALCSQKVFIDVEDRGEEIGREVFIIDVIRKGFF